MTAGLDRRLAPRPLPAHLASAAMLWLSSRAALTGWTSASPRSSGSEADRLAALAPEIARLGRDAVAAALDRDLRKRAKRLLDGLETYRRHPYRRAPDEVPVRWRQGSTRLLDYGSGGAGPAVLVVPSLVNRHYVLDLLPERSFVRRLAAAGLRPLVVDWDAPGPDERGFGLGEYIAVRLDAAAAAARALAPGPLGIIGYCMGGLLALALALRRPADAAALMLLATPWDFHAERRAQAELLGLAADWLPPGFAAVPVAVIQTLFLALDPFLAERKFRRFAELDPDGEAARMFVALEDWINDGVPLARRVAGECARSWYRDNDPARGRWLVAGEPVLPQRLACPALVVVPSRDRIVPPGSAEPLAAVLPRAETLRPPLGHIGMMTGAAAPQALWPALADWLCAHVPAG